MSDADALEAITARMTREPNPSTEVEDALRAARDDQRGQERPTLWPLINEEEIEAITARGPLLVALCERSPVRLDPRSNRTEALIDALFPGNPLLCVGHTQRSFCTKRRNDLRGSLHDCGFIVPSPMSKEKGRKRNGGMSMHSLDNTGTRWFLVVEFDRGGLDQQASLLFRLSLLAPLALVVFSGGKSLQGWFACLDATDETLHKFMNYAVSLGADRATWNRSQFVRMPDGFRRDGKTSAALQECGVLGVATGRQAALYFNSEAIR